MSLQDTIESSWKKVLSEEFEKSYFKDLMDFVKEEYVNKTIYPKSKDIFRAFELCPFKEVKVVIIGQDPYHDTDQANGLCFAVHDELKIPPSLKNIYKEIQSDLGIKPNQDGRNKEYYFLIRH